jgi:hypothetical protein
MSLPRHLSASEIEALFAKVGVTIDRQDVASVLRLVPLDGAIPPGRRGQAWVIPKSQLLQLLALCVARRTPVNFDRMFLDAAERLLSDRDLAEMMPPPLKRAVLAHRKAWRGRGRAGPG